MKVEIGIFTPSAQVISVRSHGPEFQHKTFDINSIEWQQLIEPQEIKKNYDITTCDISGMLIQLKEEIAKEHRMVNKFKELGYESTMLQTGGMKHAGCIKKTDAGWYQFTYNFDGDNTWWIISYNKENELEGDEPFYTTEETEFVDYVVHLHNLKKE